MENNDSLLPFDIMERGHTLRDALLDGDIEEVRTAIESGICRLDDEDDYGRTVLHLAACRGQLEMLRLFVDYGADVKAKDRQGNTPLHWCGHVEILEALVEMGADLFALNKMNFTPRQIAKRRGVTKDTLDLFLHLEKEAKKMENASEDSPRKYAIRNLPKQAKSLVLPSIWYEFYCDMGAKNMCLLILGLLGCALYLAYILTGLHLGVEERIPLDEQSFKFHL